MLLIKKGEQSSPLFINITYKFYYLLLIYKDILVDYLVPNNLSPASPKPGIM